jgi:ComF family protein
VRAASIVSRMFRAWAQGLAAATARVPSRCEVCRSWPSQPVCHACVQRFAQPVPRCSRCALPVPPGVPVCGACLREPPPLDACHAALAYDYPWAGLIGRFKFQGEPGWAAPLAQRMLCDAGIAQSLAVAQLVLPVPLSRGRLAERGFNQALELARRLSPARVDAHLLLRTRETLPQATLDRRERLRNVAGAFAVDPLRIDLVRGQAVILVDDVMTSGASLHAAALALRQAGAREVRALVLARTPDA